MSSRPSALPSQTTARFGMLVVAVLGTATYAYRLIMITPAQALQRANCLLANPIVPPGTLDAPNAGESPAAAAARSACLRPTELRELWHMLLGIGVTVAVTLLFYWLLPLWDRYGRRLRPLDPAVHGEVLQALDRLVAEAGLARRPTFLYSLSPRVNANTFGWFPRYYVRLDGGLLTTFVADRAAFNALVRHELAHLRHRDVDITRLTVALSLAFPVAVLVPYLLDVVVANPVQSLRTDAWRLAALAALIYFSAASVFRARDLAADAWAGDAAHAEALARVLDRQQQGAGLQWRLGELVGSHPRAARRVAELKTPRALWRLGFWESLGAGAAAGIAAAPMFDLINLSYRGSSAWILVAAMASGLVIGALAAGVVGAALWRSTLAARTEGARLPGAVVPGVGLGAGLVAGQFVAWQNGITTPATEEGGFVAAQVALIVLLVLAEIAYCGWIVLGANAWLATLRGRSPRWVFLGSLPVQVVVGAAPLALYFLLRQLLIDPLQFISTSEDLHMLAAGAWPVLRHLVLLGEVTVAVWPLIPAYALGAVLLCLLHPLAAWLRPASGEAGPRVALAAGFAGGVFYAVLTPFLWVGYSAVFRDSRTSGSLALRFLEARVWLPVLLIQAALAVAVVASVHRMRVLQGLLAAVVAGALQTIAYVATSAVQLCWVGPEPGRSCLRSPGWLAAFDAANQFLLVSPFFALLAAIVAFGIVGLAERMPSPRPGLARALAAGAMVVVVAATTAVWFAARREPLAALPADRDGCVVGSWRMESARFSLNLGALVPGEETAEFTGPVGLSMGEQVELRADGTANSAIDLVAVDGVGTTHAWFVRGATSFRWETRSGSYRIYNSRTAALTTQLFDGVGFDRLQWTGTAPTRTLPDASYAFDCTANVLTLKDAASEYHYRRIAT
jgi:hypothetical protein